MTMFKVLWLMCAACDHNSDLSVHMLNFVLFAWPPTVGRFNSPKNWHAIRTISNTSAYSHTGHEIRI